VHDTGCAGVLGELSTFRERFYRCLTSRADALFDLADAVLCAGGPITSLAELSLIPEATTRVGRHLPPLRRTSSPAFVY
jgi:hypothetical protein